MYESLGQIELRDGEKVEVGVVQGPDLEWADRVESLLGHKGEIWNWQNGQTVRAQTGIEARFYLLHRDGFPLANITTATLGGVGHFGHVWTRPADRRKGAASGLMQEQMADFRARDGRALFLGTGYDSPAYRIYASHGFRAVEERSGYMAYFVYPRSAFEQQYFAPGPIEVQAVDWRHWPSSPALFLGGFPGAVRCAPLGLFGRVSTEEALLHLVRSEGERQARGELPRARVLFQSSSRAVVGLAAWNWDPLWPATCLVDVYCHPHHWERAADLLAGLPLPEAERHLAYSDADCPQKGQVLAAHGFRQTALHPRRAALDRARLRLVGVSVWEKP